MSPFSFSRSRIRLLSFILPSAVALAFFSVWSSRQQAAPKNLSNFAVADKPGITPAGAIIFVNSTSDAANPADGLCTLREAIDNANLDTANLMTPGECTAGSGPDTIDLTGISGTIVLNSALPLINSEIILKGPGATNLNIQRSSAGGTPNFRILTVASARKLTVTGTTLSNGSVVGSGNSGGIIYNDLGATLVINNSVLQNATNGGGLSNFSGSVTINNSTISGNGGVSGVSASSAIINSVPVNNPATAPGTIVINNSTISGNNGTAISNSASVANVSSPATVTVNNSTISGNNADTGGGGAAVTNGVGTGGTAIVNLNNCTISGNNNANSSSSASSSGAIYNIAVFSGSNPTNASVNITNSTIFGNNVGTGGSGGIQAGTFSNAVNFKVAVTLRNSIVAGNTVGGGGSSDIATGTVDPGSSFNLIGTGGSGGLVNGTNNNQVGVASPGLAALANNGGPTMTNALLSTSPALDAGDNTIANNAGLTVDQRGFSRIVDGPDVDTTATVDIGAYEAQIALANLPDTSTLEDTALLVGFDPGDTSTITSVTASSSNATLVPNNAANLSVAITGSTGAVTINPATNLNGTTNITVTINRTGGGVESKTFQLTVTAVNDAPTYAGANTTPSALEDSGPQTILNWMPVISPGGGPDEAGQNLTFIVTNNSNASLFSVAPAISASGTLTFTPAADANGIAFINIVLKDDAGTANGGNDTSATGTFAITIAPVNDAPSFTKGPDQTINEDAGAQVINNWATNRSVGPSNESAQTVTFTVTNNNNSLFFVQPAVSPAGTLDYTPLLNANGSATVSVAIKDNGGTANGGVDTSAVQTFTITVNPVNDVPTFTAGANQIKAEDVGPQTATNWPIAKSAGPANESGQTLSFNITNNTNTALFSTLPAVSPAGTLTYTPAPDANGVATITINIQDNGGTASGGVDTSATQTFTITILSVNDAPSFTKGADQTVNNNAGPISIPNWATGLSTGPANESGQTLTFTITGNTNDSLFAGNGAPAVSPNGTLTFSPGTNMGGTATITLFVRDDGGIANGGVNSSPPQSFNITVIPVGGFLNFSSSTYNTTESSGSVTITVKRTGSLALPVNVDYSTGPDNGLPCSTANGRATLKCDFTATLGTFNFAAGEDTKTFAIPISQDSFIEGPETLEVNLTNATGFATLGPSVSQTAILTIADDVTEPSANAIDDATNFVRQHYHDFLSREPDAAGLAFWVNQLTSCGNDAQCLEVRRVDVSASFFLSIEFQQSGYLVERIYKAAYGDATGVSTFNGPHTLPVPVVRSTEFLRDTQRIGRGVIVLQPGWEQLLENNKQAYTLEFVQTTRFIQDFPTTMTPTQFVNQLSFRAGNVLSQSEFNAIVAFFGNAADTTNVNARAQALRMVAEDQTLYDSEYNKAFVLIQYIGYLRRNPNDPQDTNYTGYDFWLTKLNQFNGNYINAEMVKAFLSSIEYRQRFGQ